MAAHLLPRLLPFLLFVFVAVRASFSHGSRLPTTYDASMCSESFLCGSVEISYPFYLANATQATAGYSGNFSCGYTNLNISCKGDGQTWTPTIYLGGDDYIVKNISYNEETMIVADSSLFGGGNCPLVRHNVTLDEVWLHNASAFRNLTFFFDCDPVPSPGSVYEKYRIGCNGFNSPTFVFTPDDLTEEVEVLAVSCNVVFVPVNNELLREMASNRTMFTSGGYAVVLRHGFDLGWSGVKTTDDQCSQCEQSGGRCSYSQDRGFLGCLCDAGKVGNPDCAHMNRSITPASPTTSSHDNKRSRTYIIASTSGVLFLCLLIVVFFLTHKYGLFPFKSKEEPRIVSFLQKNRVLHPKRYSYADVKRMTKSFAVKLGQGGFGAVYRGNLYDGCQVAVKMLKDTKGDGEEFMNEVASISRTSHINVVSLLGFCLQGSKRALIYEYMPNGSLERYAFNRNMNTGNTLSWEKLFDITIGIARGLEYLHRGCNTRIVHFDIKPHNILLDQDFCPKISDFGLAKICMNKESVISIIGARGTIGYIAPEVYSKQFGTISSKSDVYSYGMMVLEMVGARDKNISANNESSSQYFPQWIYEHLDEYCVSASEKINGGNTEPMRKMIIVGLWCIQVLPTDRPTMTRVIEMLEGSTINLELPPKSLLS